LAPEARLGRGNDIPRARDEERCHTAAYRKNQGQDIGSHVEPEHGADNRSQYLSTDPKPKRVPDSGTTAFAALFRVL
jgi:hypothetical protein